MMTRGMEVTGVARVTFRLEYDNGKIYEVDADRPFQVDLSFTIPGLGEAWPADSYAILPGRTEVVSVELSLRGNPAHPITLRTDVKSDELTTSHSSEIGGL